MAVSVYLKNRCSMLQVRMAVKLLYIELG